ncbi:uncharacterized protein [Physcomitrium patens]|uniref:Inward rectifier potassium channel C-terminal domain-containing protein n=1 Tax=Physcomitrium patens TaxID=3218 RepID=A0A7I4CW67_PHYPA|nr:uncharacterized protein LOC112278041 isoform X3 [Physcomitrium patens]|eukprot:XP_024366815.1 uncharacterized protein LOC112278041 isoform X3 [Physcomitrella patens]
MASMKLVFVTPAGPSQNHCFSICISPISLPRWRQNRRGLCYTWLTGHDNGPGIRTVTQAGLGRYSGSIHGSRSKKTWRRNPSRISQDEKNVKELNKVEENGAQLRGAYGDDVNDDSSVQCSNECEVSEKHMVDQFHSDGTPESNLYETQFSYSDPTIDQGEESNNSSEEHDDRILETGGDQSDANLETSSVLPEDHNVDRIVVLDGSGYETQSFVSSDSEDSEVQQDYDKKAESRGTVDDENLKITNSSVLKVKDTETASSRNIMQAFRKQTANEDYGESERPRPGISKPSMQRRSSRGRRKNMPSQSSDEIPVMLYPEEAAPVAATILTNPEVFMNPSEVFSSNSDNVEVEEKASKLPSNRSRLKPYDRKVTTRGKQQKLQIRGNVPSMDTAWDRNPPSKAERPARISGSVAADSSGSGSWESLHEDVSATGQSLRLDMNDTNCHIKQSSKKSNGVARLPRLVRPKRLNDPLSQLSKLEGSAASAVSSESSVALASSATTNAEAQTSIPLPLKLVTALASKISELPLKVVTDDPAKVAETSNIFPEVVKELPIAAELSTVASEFPAKVVVETAQILKEQVVDPVVEILPDAVVEQVSNQVDQVSTKVSEQVSEVSNQVIESVSSTAAQVSETVTATVSDVSETMSTTAAQVTETVQATATAVSSKAAEVSSSIVDFLISDDDDTDSDDEFETFKTSDSPEFRGMQGLNNFHILQQDSGIFSEIYDFYIYMLKKPLPEFACAMFAAPVLLSVVFTFLYLPDVKGLALDDTARSFFSSDSPGEATATGLSLSWDTLFVIFMFSLSLSTGLQPEIAPLSPYTLVLANVNALFAQLIFVFLSGAVFARLSQPSQPVRCSTVALVCPSLAQRKRRVDSSATKVLMARYVLAGPQPCELVDVKVDLTYKYNTLTRSGSFFRATQSLKLVRSEIAYLNHGMLVRHIIDETSPLHRRTPEMLRREDSIFTLSVVGLERSSMQSIFHVQHYCVCDNHVIWDAEFEDMMLINKKNRRIIDHSKLSHWRSV